MTIDINLKRNYYMLYRFIETKNTWEQLGVSPNDQNGEPRLQKILVPGNCSLRFLGCNSISMLDRISPQNDHEYQRKA